MRVGLDQLTKPINKTIKPSQVHFDEHSPHTGSTSPVQSVTSLDFFRTQQYLEAKTSAASAVQADGRHFVRPINLAKHSSLSHLSYTDGTPTQSLASTVSPKVMMQVKQDNSTPDQATSLSFQQFLYEKFRKEFDSTLHRQSFSSKALLDHRTYDSSPPQAVQTKPTNLSIFAPSPDVRKLGSTKGGSVGVNATHLRTEQGRSSLPQQLIASKSTKLAPIHTKPTGSLEDGHEATPVHRKPRLSLKSNVKPSSNMRSQAEQGRMTGAQLHQAEQIKLPKLPRRPIMKGRV
jgi:hypothetical protein